jgi:hypothetical protein
MGKLYWLRFAENGPKTGRFVPELAILSQNSFGSIRQIPNLAAAATFKIARRSVSHSKKKGLQPAANRNLFSNAAVQYLLT